jgi:hypothetical protein
METLREAVLRLEPRIDLLHDCLGFGRFAEVTVTSDGFFLGRARGEIAFNHFLGHPSPAAAERTWQVFVRLGIRHQTEVVRALLASRIPLAAVGLIRSPERRITDARISR